MGGNVGIQGGWLLNEGGVHAVQGWGCGSLAVNLVTA